MFLKLQLYFIDKLYHSISARQFNIFVHNILQFLLNFQISISFCSLKFLAILSFQVKYYFLEMSLTQRA